jgi:hypothetical protein
MLMMFICVKGMNHGEQRHRASFDIDVRPNAPKDSDRAQIEISTGKPTTTMHPGEEP